PNDARHASAPYLHPPNLVNSGATADDRRSHASVPRRILSEDRDPGARDNRDARLPPDSCALAGPHSPSLRPATARPVAQRWEQLRCEPATPQRAGPPMESRVLRDEREPKAPEPSGRVHRESEQQASVRGHWTLNDGHPFPHARGVGPTMPCA